VEVDGGQQGKPYIARPLILPGLILQPGDMVVIVDSRGRVIRGVFLGYASAFIAIGENCKENKPYRFLNIKRINEIIVEGSCNE